ncbi:MULTISPECIES: Dps family protein [Peribacillus]|jgi:starvation-inducible DNA-binding protein|uniref:DNA starvation/stationary phase protection protein n=1 Tax=Peribacillus butanolivorans TaxID=421767 RepID=A0AAX0S3L5_9BACI|nr:DNA starvation/stationary phase protection protein [Peribacillus butanolivorans]KQU24772.1 DNA starvation/stationary phase protection protein [Bacillus sp. Leaf13]KRF65988.1 DNA starvation/stationary phase protection protein [Bacillus sp. Soil768D1]AXN38480.1 DNA starvation/stationary phase protection protein [Peribacillus butanolivorans]PEJ33476.1 DNA starvation/stationary phase protection protein [Peribacillus butanolivorans]QNU03051.1 DNA starvation/stationary phase protection protein [P
MAQKKLGTLVNKEIANFSVLYTKIHNYHWFVNGPHFFELHQKLEELYKEVTSNYDELAERLLAIGEKPVATLKEYMELTTIEEATGKENTEDMVQSVISDFEKLSEEFLEIIEVAETEDPVTADMLTGMKKSLNKHAWMLRAYLGH